MEALDTIYFYNKVCNLKCLHCWTVPNYVNENQHAHVRFEDIVSIIGQASDLGLRAFKFCGGEPLLLPYFIPLLKYLLKGGIRITIETNGMLIDTEMCSLLNGKDIFVSVSLDGPNAMTHNFIRQSDIAFEKTIEGISLLKNHEIDYEIIFSLHNGNKDYLEEMLLFAEGLGAKDLKVNVIMECGRAEDSNKLSLPDVNEILDIYKRLSAKKLDSNYFKIIFDIPPAFKNIESVVADNCRCGIKNILSVFSDGSISLCGIGNTEHSLIFGDIVHDKIKDIWSNTPFLKSIREALPSGLSGICGRCILKTVCMGKCIAQTFHHSGDIRSGYYFCEEAYSLGLFPLNRLI
ncbi:MAG: radical SAM protein [Candidatus Magnetobacterium sp. LHC-1]